MIPKNYLTHALEALEKGGSALPVTVRAILANAKDAHVFLVPDGDEGILGKGPHHAAQTYEDICNASPECNRLPFPVVAIENHYKGEAYVTLAFENPPKEFFDLAHSVDTDFIAFSIVCLWRSSDGWMIFPSMCSVLKESVEEFDWSGAPAKPLCPIGRFSFHPFAELGLRRIPNKATLEVMKDALGPKVCSLVGLLVALSCRNVCTTLVAQSPALRRARERRGKRKLYDYHVLVLDGAQEHRDIGAGGHASPAMHLRRGHVRRIVSNGLPKRTWVNACTVGKPRNGVSMKDYDARAIAQ